MNDLALKSLHTDHIVVIITTAASKFPHCDFYFPSRLFIHLRFYVAKESANAGFFFGQKASQ